MNFEQLITTQILQTSVIIFTILYIIRIFINNKWNNPILQRLLVLLPIISGIIIMFVFNKLTINIEVICNGILSGMLSMAVYKFLKDILGKDLYELIKDFFSSKNENTDNKS